MMPQRQRARGITQHGAPPHVLDPHQESDFVKVPVDEPESQFEGITEGLRPTLEQLDDQLPHVNSAFQTKIPELFQTAGYSLSQYAKSKNLFGWLSYTVFCKVTEKTLCNYDVLCLESNYVTAALVLSGWGTIIGAEKMGFKIEEINFRDFITDFAEEAKNYISRNRNAAQQERNRGRVQAVNSRYNKKYEEITKEAMLWQTELLSLLHQSKMVTKTNIEVGELKNTLSKLFKSYPVYVKMTLANHEDLEIEEALDKLLEHHKKVEGIYKAIKSKLSEYGNYRKLFLDMHKEIEEWGDEIYSQWKNENLTPSQAENKKELLEKIQVYLKKDNKPVTYKKPQKPTPQHSKTQSISRLEQAHKKSMLSKKKKELMENEVGLFSRSKVPALEGNDQKPESLYMVIALGSRTIPNIDKIYSSRVKEYQDIKRLYSELLKDINESRESEQSSIKFGGGM